MMKLDVAYLNYVQQPILKPWIYYFHYRSKEAKAKMIVILIPLGMNFCG